MRKIKYSVYGEIIESNIEPQYYSGETVCGPPDITIKYEKVGKDYTWGAGQKLFCGNKDMYGALRLYSDKDGRLYIIHSKSQDECLSVCKNEIMICSKAEEDEMKDYMWSMVDPLGLSLYFRMQSKLVIHGAALMDNNKGYAILLVAPSGSGKSTLGIGLAKTGRFSIISDDTLVVSKEKETFCIHRGFAYTRLHPVVINRLLKMDANRYKVVHSHSDKRIVPFKEADIAYCHIDKVPVGRIIYINKIKDGHSSLAFLGHEEGIKCIMKEVLFNNMITATMVLDQYRLLHDITREGKVPLCILNYRHQEDQIRRVYELLTRE